MAYKKPQDPLTNNGFGIYPLTTADQVILSDGSRLEKNGQISISGTAADSSKLGGKSANEYALKTDTAPDSSKLSGKTLAEIMLTLYPVDAVYISVNSTSPASLFGGTWEQIHGRFLLASGSPDANTDNWFGNITGGWNAVLGSTGGQDYHKLTINEIPLHDHNLIRQQWYSADQVHSSASYSIFSWKTEEGGSTSSSYNGKVEATGGDNAHNNMPPYLAVYMWKRVS